MMLLEDNDGLRYSDAATAAWPRFLVIESKNAEKPVTSLSPFVIEKTLKGCVGTVKTVRKLRSGVLLVEVNREAQSIGLCKLTNILDLDITVSLHRSMNSCRGVIRSYDLAQMTEEELLDELKAQNVTGVKQIYVTKDGQKKKTNTMILTFSQATIPTSLKAGYLNVAVQQYYPSPLRCFKCQRFGHSKFACKRSAICARCGSEEHGENPCGGPLNCINCKGTHTAYDKSCPVWIKETEIGKVKINANVSFPEARKMVEARNVHVPLTLSFANIVNCAQKAVSKRSVSTQTPIVQCKCQTEGTVLDEDEVDVDAEHAQAATQTDPHSAVKPAKSTPIPRLGAKAKEIIAANTIRLAARQTPRADRGQSSSPQSVRRPPPPKFDKNLKQQPNKTWKDTGSDPERASKGSKPSLSLNNRFSSLSSESMDVIDDTELDAMDDMAPSPSGGTKGRRKGKTPAPKPPS